MRDALPEVVPSFADQPDGVDWPTRGWPSGERVTVIDELVEAVFADPELSTTYAVVVVRDGAVLAERYGGALPSFTHEPTPVTEHTKLLSWSMAKSFVHAAVGVLVDDARLDPDAPAPVPEWRADGDARAAITLRELLQMRDGLEWCEDYGDERSSDVIEMLFGSGRADVASFAAARPLAAPPGTRFNYSSGTTNLVARIVGGIVGRGAATEAFLADRLFHPLGMDEATVTFDDAGTFIGSSFLYCTARSMARFATLYLRGGIWDGRRVLSTSWIGDAQVPTSVDVDPATYHSHHWWLDGNGTYWASGYEGQRAVVVPAKNAVVVRYGATPAERSSSLRAWCDAVVDAL
jgi:CubicO group peptidase (beta-lactamase class C family)